MKVLVTGSSGLIGPEARPGERDHFQADVSKLRALIHWTPHPNLEQERSELLANEGPLDG